MRARIFTVSTIAPSIARLGRWRLAITLSVLSLSMVVGAPAAAQFGFEEEDPGLPALLDASPIEATIAEDVVPDAAQTTANVMVPVDELKLLVKPLTVEELNVEAAAWFLLLQSKVQEVIQTEVTIKRENRSIRAQEDARQAVTTAQTKLAEVEAKLEAATPGTPAYERAAADVEMAKQALAEAEVAVQAALETAADLHSDENLKDTLAEAEITEEIASAQALLDQAQTTQQDLSADSADYERLTPTIDALLAALRDLETAMEDQRAANPNSDEYAAITTALEQARANVLSAADAIVETGLLPVDEDAQSGVESEDADATLAEIAEEVEAAGAQTDEGTEAVGAIDEEQLEEVAADLEAIAEAEADLKNQLVVNVTRLQGEQTALVDRLNIVLDELDRKGGDTEAYRLYIPAATALQLDLSDTEGLGVRLLSWLRSDEGGLRWGLSAARFFGVLLVSVVLAEVASRVARRTLRRLGSISVLFQGFLVTMVYRGTIVMGGLVAVTTLGISLGPLLAVLGGVSFVLAFALQNNLDNFASGLMLLLYKPFDVGDKVVIPGTEERGFVREITLANTSFDHYTGKILTVPNSEVWGSTIENLAPGEDRLIEFVFSVDSDDDIRVFKALWDKAIDTHPGILKDKWHTSFPFIHPQSGDFIYWCGAWTKRKGFWAVYTDLYLAMMDGLTAAGIDLTAEKHENFVYWARNPGQGMEQLRNVDEQIGKAVGQALATMDSSSVFTKDYTSMPKPSQDSDEAEENSFVDPDFDPRLSFDPGIF